MTPTTRLSAAILALLAPAAFAHDDHKLGKISFPISCNAQASHAFTDGMLLQYNYHWNPAKKAFENAAAADPGCGMAHYGTALTLMDNILAGAPTPKQLADGKAALEKARAAGLPTQREKDYVAAADVFFAGDEKQPASERMGAFANAMKRMSEAHPKDSEASVIYAWSVLASASLTDKTYSKQLQAAGILEKIAKDQPDHPGVVHFLVHAYDYPAIAHRARPAPRHYSTLFRARRHTLHLTSQTFTRMGFWQVTLKVNTETAKTCGDAEWCNPNAYDYMIYAYLKLGK